MASLRPFGIIAALLGALAFSPRARADISSRENFSGVYFPFGVNVGTALRAHGGSGLLLGGEVSALYLWHRDDYTFLGGYADYLRDFGVGVHRLSFGPEFGSHYCGIDGGAAIELGSGTTRLGWRTRVFGTLAFITLYVGEWYRPEGETNWSTEIGFLFKVPTLHHSSYKGWSFEL